MANYSDDPAVQCLLRFFSAFNDWEVETNRQYQEIDWDNYTDEMHSANVRQWKQKLAEVFETHVNAGAAAERFDDEGLHFTGSPQHSPEREKIVSTKAGKQNVVVETFDEVKKCYWKYKVIQVGDVWKLQDQRHWRLKLDGRWQKGML